MTAVRFKVRFGLGIPAVWAAPKGDGFLDFADDKVRIAEFLVPRGQPIELGDTSHLVRRPDRSHLGFRLSDVGFVAYEDAGTKSNVAALAWLGVLGLGARRRWTLITLGLSDGEAQFLTRASLQEVRGLLRAATETSPTLGSLLTEGPPPTKPVWVQSDADGQRLKPVDDLERIANLYRRGLLTDAEYSAMKAKLIAET